MRTIKFRGKHLDNRKWIYGDLCTFNGSDCEICDWNTVDCSRYDVNPATVGQFTGLLDKSGEEIYEGDIMVICNNTTVVKFSGNGFYQISICGEFSYCNFSTEVIGNIHDNPELLKTDSE